MGDFLQENPFKSLLSRARHLCREPARRHRAEGEGVFSSALKEI